MSKKITTIIATMIMVVACCAVVASCSQKKDKYYYAHEAVDLQKAYDEAKEAGDSEKMTEIKKRMQTNLQNTESCIEIENAKKKEENKK